MNVLTTKGLVAYEALALSDSFEIHPGARVHITEWRLDGELVRRDVEVNVLAPQSISSEQGL